MSNPPASQGRGRRAGALVLSCLAVGCVVGPDYVPPATPMPEGWQNSAGADGAEVETWAWWRALGDPVLEGLVERAAEANPGLRGALARIDEARALYRITAGRRVPDVDGTADVNRLQEPEAFLGFPMDETSLFDVGLTAAWEIDLFGHVTRSIEAARADYGRVLEDYRAVLVSLHADVAAAYVEVRLNQRRLAIARDNVGTQNGSLKFVSDRHEAGAASGLDLAQAQSNVASTEASIPPLEDALTRSINRLAVLLDEPFGAMRAELETPAPVPAPPAAIATGIPAELLRRRPDVRSAERALAAETARIGIETADLYPRLNLAASLGLRSAQLDELFDAEAERFTVGPSMLWNLFDGGRQRGDIAAQEARARSALASYDQTVLIALEEVEAALSSLRRERERGAALTRAVDAYRRSAELSVELYRAGQSNFQNVLDAQRNLLDFQDQLAVNEANIVGQVIALYLALGGSWEPVVPTPSERAAARDEAAAGGGRP